LHGADGEVGVPHTSTGAGITVGDVFTSSLATTFRCPHAAELRLVEGAHAFHFSCGSGTNGDAGVPVGFTKIIASGGVLSTSIRVGIEITAAIANATNVVGGPEARTFAGVGEPVFVGTKASSFGTCEITTRSTHHCFSVPPAVAPRSTLIAVVSTIARGDTAHLKPLAFVAVRTVIFVVSGRARLFCASHGGGVPLTSIVGVAH